MKVKFCLIVLLFFTVVLTTSCSDSCEDKDPTVTLINNGTNKADIQIKTTGGNTENINNVAVGEASEKRTFSPGDIEFTITVSGVESPAVYTLSAKSCYNYTVRVNSDNTVSANGDKVD